MKVPSVGQIAQDFHKFAFARARGLELKCEHVDSQRSADAPRIESGDADGLNWNCCPDFLEK